MRLYDWKTTRKSKRLKPIVFVHKHKGEVWLWIGILGRVVEFGWLKKQRKMN